MGIQQISEDMQTVRGKFKKNERMLFFDLLNGTLLTPQIVGQSLYYDIAEILVNDEEGYLTKWGIDVSSIEAAAATMSNYDWALLEIYSRGYWDIMGGSGIITEEDTDDYLSDDFQSLLVMKRLKSVNMNEWGINILMQCLKEADKLRTNPINRL